MNKLKIGILVLAMVVTLQLGVGELETQTTPRPQDINCLAKNIYYEARGEPVEGQIAVAQVTLNRVRSGTFGSSICKVVYAKNQFSWTLDKRKKINSNKEWDASKALALEVLNGKSHIPNFNALYFHTKHIRPRWARTKTKVTIIANHIFYT